MGYKKVNVLCGRSTNNVCNCKCSGEEKKKSKKFRKCTASRTSILFWITVFRPVQVDRYCLFSLIPPCLSTDLHFNCHPPPPFPTPIHGYIYIKKKIGLPKMVNQLCLLSKKTTTNLSHSHTHTHTHTQLPLHIRHVRTPTFVEY